MSDTKNDRATRVEFVVTCCVRCPCRTADFCDHPNHGPSGTLTIRRAP